MSRFTEGRRTRRDSDGPWIPDLVTAQRSFGLKLHATLTDQFPGRNIFFSPANLGSALALLYYGSKGANRRVIAEVLGFRDVTPDQLNQFFAAYQSLMKSPAGDVDIAKATALWVKTGSTLNDEFVRVGSEWFDIEISQVDFKDPQTRIAINTWVANKTCGLIESIGGALDPEGILLLTSAIYFKGLWALPFDRQRTKEGLFTTHDGSLKQIAMMRKTSEFHYLEERDFQAVRLDYKGGQFSLYLFLPAVQSDLQRFQATLSAKSWGQWIPQFKLRPGTVILPRFQVKYSASFQQAFESLGLGVLFDPDSANFDGILSDDPSPFLTGVHHQAIVDLDEEGTEAAAVTELLQADSYTPKPPRVFLMQVDRPFFFAIQDNSAGIPLFLGSVLDAGSTP